MQSPTFVKIKNSILRRVMRKLKLHPTSYPYISGDTFRQLANHVHDMDKEISALNIKLNDIVFVQSPRLIEFFTTIHPQITNKYILISHNGDENITHEQLKFIDDKIIHWFPQNCLVPHPKITPLPIGLENKWYHLHGIPSYFDRLRLKKVVKKKNLLYKFNVSTNPPERQQALIELQKHPLALTYTDWRESYKYLETLQNNNFVVSPPGNGMDCHRTWEALYLGTVPIVKKSYLTSYFEKIGLPLLVIDDWSDLKNINENNVMELYGTMSKLMKCPALFADYWINLILDKKI